jgi:hypothetical protein
MIRDIEILEGKSVGLADAMAGKYDWWPAERARSVGEVFMHVAGANLFEHLGPALAYAPTNGVVPPWRAGGRG